MAEFKPAVQTKGGKVPVCPNHGEPLMGVPTPPPRKGVGKCPVSRCDFAFEIDSDEDKTTYEKDLNGNLVPVHPYKVTGEEK